MVISNRLFSLRKRREYVPELRGIIFRVVEFFLEKNAGENSNRVNRTGSVFLFIAGENSIRVLAGLTD